jgi:hypothetical protein
MYLLGRTARSMSQVALVCGAIGVAACLVRLLPWLASGSVPLRATAAFAQTLLLAALEITLLVAPSVGVSLELARASADGSLRALACAGASPLRLLAPVAVAACIAAVAGLGVSTAWGAQASRPGRLVNQVLSAGRNACDSGPRQAPLAGVSWLCHAGTSVMVGQLKGPDERPAGVYSAADAAFSDDLGRLQLSGVQAWLARPQVHGRFDTVTVTGIVPWLAASPAAPLVRGAACALAAVAAALGSAWMLLWRATGSRAVALAIGASGPAAFLLVSPTLLALPPPWAVLGAALSALSGPVLVGTAFSALRLPGALPGGTNS